MWFICTANTMKLLSTLAIEFNSIVHWLITVLRFVSVLRIILFTVDLAWCHMTQQLIDVIISVDFWNMWQTVGNLFVWFVRLSDISTRQHQSETQ